MLMSYQMDPNFEHNLEAISQFPKDNPSAQIKAYGGRLFSDAGSYFSRMVGKATGTKLEDTVPVIMHTCQDLLHEINTLLATVDSSEGAEKVIKKFNDTSRLLDKVRTIRQVYSERYKDVEKPGVEQLKEAEALLERDMEALRPQIEALKARTSTVSEARFTEAPRESTSAPLEAHKAQSLVGVAEGSGSLELESLVDRQPLSDIEEGFVTISEKGEQEAPEPTLELGSLVLHRMPPTDLKPGDIICTYESTSSQPTIVQATFAQSFTQAGKEKNLHKMLHFEIVLEVLPGGRMKVAHANGLTSTVSSEVQDPSKYPPGTAIVVMRPKNEALRAELITVATTTVDKGNTWRIKGLSDRSGTMSKMTGVAKTAYKARMKGYDAKLMQMARLAVDSYSRFAGKDETKLKAMSCAQFATNVINSSLIRMDPRIRTILENKSLNREQKTSQIFKLLQQQEYKEVVAACGLFHEDVTSTLLTHQLITHPDQWEVPGYIGLIDETAGPSTAASAERTNCRPILSAEIKQLDFEPSETYAVFESLGLLRFSGTQGARDIKLMIAFAYLYAKKYSLNPTDVVNAIFNMSTAKKPGHSDVSPEKEDFLTKAPAQLKIFLQKVASFQTNPITPQQILEDRGIGHTAIPLADFTGIGLAVVKKIDPEYSALEKAHIITLLTVDQHRQTAAKVSFLSGVITMGAGVAAAGILFTVGAAAAPVAAPILIGAGLTSFLYSKYTGARRTLAEWSSRVEKTYERAKPTHALKLKSDVGFGRRPWLLYSGDGGKTYVIERLTLKEGTTNEWIAKLHVEQGLQYKFFVGPEELDLANPFQGVRWQAVEGGGNAAVTAGDLNGEVDASELHQLPDCSYPAWE